MMNPVSMAFWMTLTLLVYFAATRVYARTGRNPLAHPVLWSIICLILLLWVTHADYNRYADATTPLSFLLQPAVVALGVPLYENLNQLRKKGWRGIISMLIGSATGICSASVIAWLLGASHSVVLSVAPRSVTTPIAMGIAGSIGGIPHLTVGFVVATGVLGAVLGPSILGILGIRDRITWGLALGAASHGIGTARAFEDGEEEGAASSVAMAVNGVLTAILTPILLHWLGFL